MEGSGKSCCTAAHHTDMASVIPPARRGATLLELVVALAIMGIAILISADLILASARLEEGASAALRDPSVAFAGIWLRRDVDNAKALSSSAGAWSTLPLSLIMEDGATVAYDLSGHDLVRTELSPSDPHPVTRQLLQGVVSWRWRVRAGRVVDMVIRLPNRTFSPRGARLTAPVNAVPPTREETFTIGRRGLAGGGTW